MQISKYPPLIDRRNYLPPPLQVFHILVSCFLCGQFHGIGGVGRGDGGGNEGGCGGRDDAIVERFRGAVAQENSARIYFLFFPPLAGPAAALS